MTYSYERTAARGPHALDLMGRSDKARNAIWHLDEKYIGTADYMGVAYFWSMEYKWWLRDASPKVRRKVHKAFVDARLPVDEDSEAHTAIVAKFFPDAAQRLRDMGS